jgi:hypothetical protein
MRELDLLFVGIVCWVILCVVLRIRWVILFVGVIHWVIFVRVALRESFVESFFVTHFVHSLGYSLRVALRFIGCMWALLLPSLLGSFYVDSK